VTSSPNSIPFKQLRHPWYTPNQSIISFHHTIFQTPQVLPPSCDDHDHSISLILGSLPPNVRPYHHHFSQNNEIEKIIHELLEAGVIHPSTSPYSSPIFKVFNKEGTWCMCPDFSFPLKTYHQGKVPHSRHR
jgi:hypothetical protein